MGYSARMFVFMCMGSIALTGFAQVTEYAPDSDARTDTTDVEEVDLLHADELRKDTPDELHLIGAVHLRQGKTDLRSDRAIEYTLKDEILFVGNVVIVERGDTLTSDEVHYDKRTKTGIANGQVRLSDGDVVVRAPSGTYFAEGKKAIFDDGVTLVDSTAVLTSLRGAYWSDEKRAEFYNEVNLTGDQSYLEADSVIFFREREVSVAHGHVFIERTGDNVDGQADSTRTRTFLFGDRAYNDDREAVSRITGAPLLVQFQFDSTGTVADTLVVSARRLETIQQDSLQRLTAVDDVKIWQPSLSAVGDSVVYEKLRIEGQPIHEESRMYRGPTAWFQQAQISGDTLRIVGHAGGVDTLFVLGDAFAARIDTVTNRISQLKGLTMRGLFQQDSLRTLIVRPNAQAIYFMRDADTGRTKGAVRASSDRVVFDMRGDGALRDIRFYRGVEGEMYEETLIPDPLVLDGFNWAPDLAPEQEILFPKEMRKRIMGRLQEITSEPQAPTSKEASSAFEHNR